MKFKGTKEEVKVDGRHVELANGKLIAQAKPTEEGEANAELFAEAINVVNECGFSPRELLEQREKLLVALKSVLIFLQPKYKDSCTKLIQSIEAPFTLTQPRFQFDVGYIASILNEAEWVAVANSFTTGFKPIEFGSSTCAYEAAKYLSTKTFGQDSIRKHIDQGYEEIVEKLDLENRLGWESIGEIHMEAARYLAPILAKEKLTGKGVKRFDLEAGATFHLKE